MSREKKSLTLSLHLKRAYRSLFRLKKISSSRPRSRRSNGDDGRTRGARGGDDRVDNELQDGVKVVVKQHIYIHTRPREHTVRFTSCRGVA